MGDLLTAAEMRQVEQAAIQGGSVTGLELMERAGRGVVEAVFQTWPGLSEGADRRAVVLCGPGNNGGDGFVIARLLHDLGWAIDVYLLGDATRLPADARANHDRWDRIGAVRPIASAELDHGPAPDLVIDALFGTGLARPVQGLAAVQLVLNDWHAGIGGPVIVAVDVPSGLCSDSGRYLGYGADEHPLDTSIRADLTVTFHTAKPGHYLDLGPAACGTLVIKEIGL